MGFQWSEEPEIGEKPALSRLVDRLERKPEGIYPSITAAYLAIALYLVLADSWLQAIFCILFGREVIRLFK